MTSKEAAERLGCTRSWITKLIARGELVVVRGEIVEETVAEYERKRKLPGRPEGTFKKRP